MCKHEPRQHDHSEMTGIIFRLILDAFSDWQWILVSVFWTDVMFTSLSGLGTLFSAPDLSGISDKPLRVAAVRHATTVELSEEGVEASATTVVTATRSISAFTVNSPFLFALVDDVSLTPLFMGIVTNPAPDNEPMLKDEPQTNGTVSDGLVTDKKRHLDNSSEVKTAEGSTGQPCNITTAEKKQEKADESETCSKTGFLSELEIWLAS